MLSYTEHGKFRPPTQAATPKRGEKSGDSPDPARISADALRFKWIMGCADAQWSTTRRHRNTVVYEVIRATFRK
jgi:hypothetical protein